MKTRLRSNFAWFLRGIAKWFNARAERIEPIKLTPPRAVPPPATVHTLPSTSKQAALDIIARAMQRERQ